MNSSASLLRGLIFVIALIFFSSAGLVVVSVNQGRIAYEREALAQTENLARVLERNIAHIIGKADVSLGTVARVADQLDGRGKNTVLAQQLALQPELLTLKATDATGALRFGLTPGEAVVNLADRDYFRILRDHPTSGLVISQPLFLRSMKQWGIAIARPYLRADGSFGGIVIATVSSEQFRRLFANMDLGRYGAISLRTTDLALVARQPAPEVGGNAIGSNKVSSQLAEAVRQHPDAGTYLAETALDGIQRANAYRKVADYPLLVIVGLATEDYQRAWRGDVAKLLALAVLLMLVTVAAAVLIYRYAERQRLAASALALETQRYQVLLHTASDGIHVLDQLGNVIEASDSFCAMLGYSREEVIGMNISVWDVDHTAEDVWAKARQGAGFAPVIIETKHRRKDGSVFDAEVAIHAFQLDGEPVLCKSARDISERKRAEAVIVRAKEAAEAGNQAKSRFLATMSHEVRTPLNAVLGMAHLLAMPRLTDEERISYARTITESGKALLDMLTDIIDHSRVESGRLELTQTDFAPGELLGQVADLFGPTAREKGLAFETAWQGDATVRYRGDPQRLRQMMANFVSNAIKFTEAGSVRVEGREVARDGTQATLEFAATDTGIGVAADQQERLFQPFSQIEDSATRRFGGSGLGLSLVAQLAMLMGGQVGVESVPGRGSRFWFRVPVSLA